MGLEKGFSIALHSTLIQKTNQSDRSGIQSLCGIRVDDGGVGWGVSGEEGGWIVHIRPRGQVVDEVIVLVVHFTPSNSYLICHEILG